MKTLALLCLSALSIHGQDLCGPQPQQLTPIVFRIPGLALKDTIGPSGDAIQVIVRTGNKNAIAIRVIITYIGNDGPVTVSSDRPIPNGFDIHTFPVKDYQVPIVSVVIKELAAATEQTYTGF